MQNSRSLQELEKSLNYFFRNRDLLASALTHRSFQYDLGDPELRVKDYEALEFLGDAVVGLLVCEHLYRQFPDKCEGELSKIKSVLVSKKELARLSDSLGLGDFVRLGKGEVRSGGRHKSAILADIFESITAAIYLDGGLSAARTFLALQLRGTLETIEREGFTNTNFKSMLQELLHSRGKPGPVYRLASEQGPPHRRHFITNVYLEEGLVATGSGPTKKDSEQAAAEIAFRRLGNLTGTSQLGEQVDEQDHDNVK